MTRADLEAMEEKAMELVVSRRQLGGFDVNAEAILLLSEMVMRLTQHAKDKEPIPAKKK